MKGVNKLNQNIEVINPHLWSVRFSLLPWIPDIKVEERPDYPLHKEMCRNIKGGIMLLNADHKDYSRFREGFLYLQKMKFDDLKKVWEMLHGTPNKTDVQVVKQAMIRMEIDRRNREEPKKPPLWKRLLKRGES